MESVLLQMSPWRCSKWTHITQRWRIACFPQLKYCSCERWQFNYCNLKTNCGLISVMVCDLYSLPEGKWHRLQITRGPSGSCPCRGLFDLVRVDQRHSFKNPLMEKSEKRLGVTHRDLQRRAYLSANKVTRGSICEAVSSSERERIASELLLLCWRKVKAC